MKFIKICWVVGTGYKSLGTSCARPLIKELKSGWQPHST
jgi:hypothetical protein